MQIAIDLQDNHEGEYRLRAQRALELYCSRRKQVNSDQFRTQKLEDERRHTRRGQEPAQFHPTREEQRAGAEAEEPLDQRDPTKTATKS